MEKIEKKILAVVDKLKRIIDTSIKKGNYRKALDAMTAAAFILEEYNQYYVDDVLENNLQEVAKAIVKPGFTKDELDTKTVLYYDSFGDDVRGLSLVYLTSLVELGYRIIYVTKDGVQNTQPQLHESLKDGDVKWVYVSNIDRTNQADVLTKLFKEHKPAKAFLYSTPDDSAALAVFTGYEGIVERYKINLTDHAYWLGTKAFDYNFEFRNYGACVSHKYRGIDKDRLILMPFYPYHKPQEFAGLPFEKEPQKLMFSGGWLYKTLGDPQNRYYDAVTRIMEHNSDLSFLYAGKGDDSEIVKLQAKFPGRVVHIEERADFYEIMEHVTIYMNTFPMVGGLMMQYAASAGKVPLTLKPDDKNVDAAGILINQERVEYRTVDELVEEVDKLLSDEAYRDLRADEMRTMIITPEVFTNELKNAFELHKTTHNMVIQDIDTSDFRAPYITRFKDSNFRKVIASNNKKSLLPNFPWLFFQKTYNKIIKKEKLN
ncbi:MAG: glycosyltransferase family 4 protein [Saccharofermentans sp.]|nr:glycosyltransferase family 4 protein [Saccharofermentans sp.]